MKMLLGNWPGAVFLLVTLLAVPAVNADVVDFRVDPATIDANSDGFITGSEFQPVGSDGTIFDLLPTVNLVGFPRFLLTTARGLQFGGGGGSTLEFDFTVSQDITLESYTLPTTGLMVNNPFFDIREGATVLSSGNSGRDSGDTYAFAGGPIGLTAGTTYTFDVTTGGAAVQSFMQSWEYTTTPVPEPGALGLLASFGAAIVLRRRK